MATFDWLLVGPPCFYSEGPPCFFSEGPPCFFSEGPPCFYSEGPDLNWQSHGHDIKKCFMFL